MLQDDAQVTVSTMQSHLPNATDMAKSNAEPSQTTSANDTPPTILTLAAETRNTIYELVIEDWVDTLQLQNRDKITAGPEILRSCHQIRTEAFMLCVDSVWDKYDTAVENSQTGRFKGECDIEALARTFYARPMTAMLARLLQMLDQMAPTIVEIVEESEDEEQSDGEVEGDEEGCAKSDDDEHGNGGDEGHDGDQLIEGGD